MEVLGVEGHRLKVASGVRLGQRPCGPSACVYTFWCARRRTLAGLPAGHGMAERWGEANFKGVRRVICANAQMEPGSAAQSKSLRHGKNKRYSPEQNGEKHLKGDPKSVYALQRSNLKFDPCTLSTHFISYKLQLLVPRRRCSVRSLSSSSERACPSSR